MVKDQGRFLIDTTRNLESGFYGGSAFFEYGGIRQEDVMHRYKAAYKEFYSLSKQLRIAAKIRSWSELCWLATAVYSIVILHGLKVKYSPNWQLIYKIIGKGRFIES